MMPKTGIKMKTPIDIKILKNQCNLTSNPKVKWLKAMHKIPTPNWSLWNQESFGKPHVQHHWYPHTPHCISGHPPSFCTEQLHLGHWWIWTPPSADANFLSRFLSHDFFPWLGCLHFGQNDFLHTLHLILLFFASDLTKTPEQSGVPQKKESSSRTTLRPSWNFTNLRYTVLPTAWRISSSVGFTSQPNSGHFRSACLFWSSIRDLNSSVKHSEQNRWFWHFSSE